MKIYKYNVRCEVIIEIFVNKNYNSYCIVPKSNILLIILKAVPDHGLTFFLVSTFLGWGICFFKGSNLLKAYVS